MFLGNSFKGVGVAKHVSQPVIDQRGSKHVVRAGTVVVVESLADQRLPDISRRLVVSKEPQGDCVVFDRHVLEDSGDPIGMRPDECEPVYDGESEPL